MRFGLDKGFPLSTTKKLHRAQLVVDARDTTHRSQPSVTVACCPTAGGRTTEVPRDEGSGLVLDGVRRAITLADKPARKEGTAWCALLRKRTVIGGTVTPDGLFAHDAPVHQRPVRQAHLEDVRPWCQMAHIDRGKRA